MKDKEVVEKVTRRFGLEQVIREIVKDLRFLEENMGQKLGPRTPIIEDTRTMQTAFLSL